MHATSPINALRLGPHEAALRTALRRAADERWAERLWQRDTGLWGEEPERREAIAGRLGWLDAPAFTAARTAELAQWAGAARAEGLDDVVLCGMGGSSLAPELFARAFGSAPGYPRLRVLDTTHPDPIRAVTDATDPARTLYLVSSKSGTTIETDCLHRHFREHAPASRFVAVTDPATVLAGEAEAAGFHRCFLNPEDIGGRFSALSYFGMVPAALLGIDTAGLAASALTLLERSRHGDAENPGLVLGLALGTLAAAGRDRLTLRLSPRLAPLGAWIEQLVAESTGKEGRGILPVDGEPPVAVERYGDDRVFAVIELDGDQPAEAADIDALVSAGHPVLRWRLPSLGHLGAELLLWEIATAVAGVVLDVNPFDEPNVSESKAATAEMLGRLDAGGSLPPEAPTEVSDGLRLYPGGANGRDPLAGWLATHRQGDYVALLSYLPPSPDSDAALARLRRLLLDRLGAAITLGSGPRFLHSTGQIHKGGSDRGLFLQIAGPVDTRLPVPGRAWSFGELQYAQAWGDLAVLRRRGRRVLHVEVEDASALTRLAHRLGAVA